MATSARWLARLEKGLYRFNEISEFLGILGEVTHMTKSSKTAPVIYLNRIHPIQGCELLEDRLNAELFNACRLRRIKFSDDITPTVSKLLGEALPPSKALEWLLDRYLNNNATDEFAGRDRAIEAKRRQIRQLVQIEIDAAERAEKAASKPLFADFYSTRTWQRLRYKCLAESGGRCALCGRSAKVHGVVLHVDHIKPRSLFPELAHDPENLQALCEDCNMGKGNRDNTDWRN